MFFQDGLTGSAWGDWALYTGSPLRAFESELGVQDPVGFWDPAGFTADGSVENFQRRRQTELKHGRVGSSACSLFESAMPPNRLPGFSAYDPGDVSWPHSDCACLFHRTVALCDLVDFLMESIVRTLLPIRPWLQTLCG